MKTAMLVAVFVFLMTVGTAVSATDPAFVDIGLNYPATGPYSIQGLDQIRGAQLALEEINGAGGILGRQVRLVIKDTRSQPDIAVQNAVELIERHNVPMIFGGASSAVAVAVGTICQNKGVVFMATITASNATTRENGHRHTFRVCYDAWMGAKALSHYLNAHFQGKRYLYIVSNYTWGWSSEDSIRKFTGTENRSIHKRFLTRLGGNEDEFAKAMLYARQVRPDVIVLVLFGQDMSTAIRYASQHGLNKQARIVVPILELGLSEGAGPQAMEGVIGTSDWNWKVPYEFGYSRGIQFVEEFTRRYDRYPCWGAATAYTNLMEYAAAVQRAGTFHSEEVIHALENHSFTLLKDEQTWRDFDHQNVQSVYVVECNPKERILQDRFKLNYFRILSRFPGQDLVQTRQEWESARRDAVQDITLELFPSEHRARRPPEAPGAAPGAR